jgi:YbbR domain-containing protein
MRWLTNNIGLKLASLALAAMLSGYVYVYINYPTTQTLYLPLRIRSVSSGLVIASQQPEVERVLVRVRGPFRSIKQMLSSNHQALLDCTEVVNPGVEVLRVQLPDFGDLVVTGQDPNFITLTFEKKESLKLDVRIDRRGLPQKGFMVESENTQESAVDISGPVSIIDRVKYAQVEPNVADAAQDMVSDETVRLYDNAGSPVADPSITITPDTIRYSMHLSPASDSKPLTVVPDYTGLPPRQYILAGISAKPAYIAVPAELVPPGVFTVRTSAVDLSTARSNFTATVSLIYPFKTPKVSNLPVQCEVQVQIASLEEESAGAARIKVQLRHANPKLEYVLSPPEVIVRADELTMTDSTELRKILAVLDVEALGPGEHMLSPQIVLPPQISHATIIPNIIKLTVIKGGK